MNKLDFKNNKNKVVLTKIKSTSKLVTVSQKSTWYDRRLGCCSSSLKHIPGEPLPDVQEKDYIEKMFNDEKVLIFCDSSHFQTKQMQKELDSIGVFYSVIDHGIVLPKIRDFMCDHIKSMPGVELCMFAMLFVKGKFVCNGA